MAKALGQTPEEATAPGIDGLPKYLTGNVGLVLTNRPVEAVLEYFNNMSLVDFARARELSLDFRRAEEDVLLLACKTIMLLMESRG